MDSAASLGLTMGRQRLSLGECHQHRVILWCGGQLCYFCGLELQKVQQGSHSCGDHTQASCLGQHSVDHLPHRRHAFQCILHADILPGRKQNSTTELSQLCQPS